MAAQTVTLHLSCRACARPVTLQVMLDPDAAMPQRSTFCPYDDCLGIAIFPSDVNGRVLSIHAGHGGDSPGASRARGDNRPARR
jgi:hypothetical protein